MKIVKYYSNYYVFDPTQKFLVYLRHHDPEVLKNATKWYEDNEQFKTKLVASNIGKERDMYGLLFQLRFHGFLGKVDPSLRYTSRIQTKHLTQKDMKDIIDGIIVDDEEIIKLAHEIKESLSPEKRDKPAHLLYAIKGWMRNISYERDASYSSEKVLSSKEANCLGNSRLFCALARILGIPSELSIGIVLKEDMIPKLCDHTHHYPNHYLRETIDDFFSDSVYNDYQELFGSYAANPAWEHAFTAFKSFKDHRLDATKQLLTGRTNELKSHAWVKATLPQGIVFIESQNKRYNDNTDYFFDDERLYGYPIFSKGQFSDELAPMIISSNDYVSQRLLNDLDNLLNDSPLIYQLRAKLRINEVQKIIESLTSEKDKNKSLPEKPWWIDETRLEACARKNRLEEKNELELLAGLRMHDIPVSVYESYSGRKIPFDILEKFDRLLNEPNKDNVEIVASTTIASTTDETSITRDEIGITIDNTDQEHLVYKNNGKLFLSYSKLLYLVAGDKVTEEEMKKGLFFFGCPVQYFEDPENSTIITAINLAQTEEEKRRLLEAYDIMKNVVNIASMEGRTYFRSKEGHVSISDLDGFLERNGVDVSAVTSEEERFREKRFNYPTVKRDYKTVVDVIY